MNVLSIDFDWIMEPVIEAYNTISDIPDISYHECWNIIQDNFPNLHYYCNNTLLKKIFEIIKYFPNQVIFGKNHHEILSIINNDFINILVNIDHHHDCYGIHADQNNEIHCGNWVDFLFDNNQIFQYIWINNSTSNINQGNFFNYLKNNKAYIEKNIDYILENIKFDKIFLCLSPTWIPPQCMPLWDILVNYYNIICENDTLRKSEE